MATICPTHYLAGRLNIRPFQRALHVRDFFGRRFAAFDRLKQLEDVRRSEIDAVVLSALCG
jgi:hypothetical protein